MIRFVILLYICVSVLSFSTSCSRQDTQLPDEINHRAYLLRYTDVDSSLNCAKTAFKQSELYPDGRAEALNHIAFAQFQQMRFSKAQFTLRKIDSLTNNQVELLCADVMNMKISQRTGELRIFYNSWHSAQQRLKRIDEEEFLLTPHLKNRLFYARTEMHIIASTYYFYSQQDSASLAELKTIEPLFSSPKDTAQWVSYMYLLGASAIIRGDSTDISIAEFDNLVRVLSITHRTHDKYFHANSLQALSLILDNPYRLKWISKERGGSIDFLVGQYAKKVDDSLSTYSLPLILIDKSLAIFREYGDLFQIANVLRTKAELLFKQKKYDEALLCLNEAIDIVELQHSIDTKRVSYWEARIYEQLSLTYSALGYHSLALANRKIYLNLLEAMRQDLEEDARAEELQTYNHKLFLNLLVITGIILLFLILFWILSRKLRTYNRKQEKIAEEFLQSLRDNIAAREMELSRERLNNIERRAKVSLAENVVPYINRLLNTLDREYISELSTEILRINDVLTQWIKIQHGKVAMNISTFHLQSVLDIIAHNRVTYSRESLTLLIPHVEFVVKADRALTLFMINTICDNARKFTPKGGTISVSVIANDDFVEISVIDTGCGLSEENVERINNSKVFRLEPISVNDVFDADNRKGFGFGLMNCKGIIAEMKKMSTRFSCCDFGVESRVGKGSRFWFRLPRVLSVLLIIFTTHFTLYAKTDYSVAYDKYVQLKHSNTSLNFHESINYAKEALMLVPDDSIHLRMLIENELAIAYLSLNDWDAYRKHNLHYLRLYRTITADPNLPIYAKRLHMLRSETSWSFFLTIILFIVSLLMLFLFVRRSSRRRLEHIKKEDFIISQSERLNRLQYELDRLHVQNSILDNGLSTIKHETMYYPARIHQLAMNESASLSELTSFITYYNDVYTILLEQLQRQVTFKVVLDDIVLDELKTRIKSAIFNKPVTTNILDRGNIWEVRIKALNFSIPDNLFTYEGANLDALVAREIIRMHDAASGYPGLRLYVENNEIVITLWKNSKLLLLKTFS